MIRIAQAASSETFGNYGTPPNQRRTGVTKNKPEGNLDGELNIIPFYASNWKAVFRAKDEKIADKIAWLAERAVANGSGIGYGQNGTGPWNCQRTGLFDALYSMADPDPAKIPASTPVNCDCSSSTGAFAFHAGVYEPGLRNMNTYTEEAMLMATGAFIELKDRELLESAVGCRRGDIYWREGHTMICLDTNATQETTPSRISDCFQCNMRKGPGMDYGVIRVLNSGMIVDKVSTAYDEDGDPWAKIQHNGETGYVAAKYVKTLPTATVTGDVWMRKDAGTNYAPLIVIPKGTQDCYLTGQTKKVLLTTWYECVYAGYRGYASGKYIKQ